jgi:adhesin transport system membrane fusion protein
MAREEAEAMGQEKLVLPEELAEKNPDLVERAETFFQTRLNRYRSEMTSQEELIIQRQQEVREIEVRIANTRNSLKLLDEQIKISDELMKDQLTNRYNHIQLLRERSDMRSSLDEDGEGLHGARAGFKEAKTRLEQIRHAFQERAREDLAKSRREFDELSQRIRKFEDSLKRTVVRAPVDGVVKDVLVSTVGGVLQPGDTVAELVPVGDRLIVEAELPIQDIGYVQVGQHAIIKLNSPDLVRFGKLDGTVVRISPDKLVRDDGQPYYRVRIDTERNYFERDNQRYELFPGTQVVASIQTGKRTVVEYLLDPFIGSLGEAMRER